MRTAYLDLFSGISGDMTLGALVDAGVPLKELKRALSKVPLRGYRVTSRRVLKGELAATKVAVRIEKGHRHSHVPLKKVLGLIRRSGLPAAVKESANGVFLRLARAEGRIHRKDPMKVEFHEVGAVDSIVDVVGSCFGFHFLDVKKVCCSRVPVSRGEIRCHHGVIPNPGPATMELLKGFPLIPVDVDRELVTPTGAALLASLVHDPGRFPAMTLEATGYGAGDLEIEGRANVLRLLVGTAATVSDADSVYMIETNLDDAPGELVGYLFDRLFAAGAVDVYTTAIQMKKSRPAVKVSVLVPPSHREGIEDVLLRETPTFGVRRILMERSKLHRHVVKVRTRYGTIRCKVGRLNGEVVKAAPEFEDVKSAAGRHRAPLARVIEATLQAFTKMGTRERKKR